MRYIGCKTLLLPNIKSVIEQHAPNAKTVCDIFSGTATVARYLKNWYEVHSNDILYFSYCLQMATVQNPKTPDFSKLVLKEGISNPIQHLNSIDTKDMGKLPQSKRFFQNNYSPKGGRMYVTEENALRIDFSRITVEKWYKQGLLNRYEYYYLIASIVEGIPFVSNIAGTYGAFSKTWDKRAHKTFQLIELPVVENGKANKSYQKDANELIKNISGDVLYIDPPYNERQYLPNYHLLETAAKYDYPVLRGVTGQREYGDKQKSLFCSKRTVLTVFEDMIRNANFKHIILSYNTDGIMSAEDIEKIMKKHGNPHSFEIHYIDYRRYKSRQLVNNTSNLKEMLVYVGK